MGRKPALRRDASLRPERDALEERRTTRTSATSPRRTGEADETVSSTSTALGREAERETGATSGAGATTLGSRSYLRSRSDLAGAG